MILAMLQPQFAPNLFDLSAMLKADRIVWTDVEKWSRKGRTHRSLIRGQNGLQWVNLPIVTEDKEKAINQVRIAHRQNWFTPFWNAIYHNYRTATYFDLFVDELQATLEQAAEHEKLLEFNLFFFKKITTWLELNLKPELASAIPQYHTLPDQFAANMGAKTLYLEHQSKNYQRQSKAAETALTKHPIYRQAASGFVEGAGLLDMLLNHGKESFRIFDQIS